jgi:hypothetical protein
MLDFRRQEGARVFGRRVGVVDFRRQEGARAFGWRLLVPDVVHADPRCPGGHWLYMASPTKRISLIKQSSRYVSAGMQTPPSRSSLTPKPVRVSTARNHR